MAGGYGEIAYESIPGNETNAPVLSTKKLYPPLRELNLKPNPKHLERDDENRNIDEPLVALPEAYDPDWDLDVRAYPDVSGFLLKGILGDPVTTAGNGVITDPDTVVIPVGATRHVWTAPYGPTGINPLTAQIQGAWKDQGFFLKAKGAGFEKLALETPESGGAGLKAEGPANYLVRISDPAVTPSYESLTIPPFERGHLMLVTWLGGTANSEDFNIEIENPIEQARSMGIASKFPDLIEKGDPPIVVSGSVPKRVIDPDDFDALMAATGFAIKVRWKSTVNIGATAYPYTLWFEAPNCQYMEGAPEGLANKRRLGASFDWKATLAGASGSSKWTLVNGTASYA